MNNTAQFRLKNLGINAQHEAVLYLREDCHVCQSEGFSALARVQVNYQSRSLMATLHTVQAPLLEKCEAGLSTYAVEKLGVTIGDIIQVSHPKIVHSLSYIRAKIYGNSVSASEINQIIQDIATGQLSDIHVAMFLTAFAGNHYTVAETIALTQAMVAAGERLSWVGKCSVDKHCVGGVPGNRTTLIVVPIIAAFGLTIPKTSSRAITSPTGTADTMEVFAPVNLNINTMRQVVERENGCVIWGGSVALSPVDDLLIRIERVMNLDSEAQMVASILSKKVAAGAEHLLVNIPIGKTAKVRSQAEAQSIQSLLETVAQSFGLKMQTVISDGSQPVGRGIGPALEARDVWAVLSNAPDAPQDLRESSLILAGALLEFSPQVAAGSGKVIAQQLLDSGKALAKFIAICEAQGGLRTIPEARHVQAVLAEQGGVVIEIDNRHIARVAKLAGAPDDKAAGVKLNVRVGDVVVAQQPLFEIHAESQGALEYALSFLQEHRAIQVQ